MKVLELYCGLGGAAAALGDRADVVAAVDQNRVALGVYARNFPHPLVPATIESLSAARLGRFEADLWWMSPPCQPFTRRGLGRDVDDRRAKGLLTLLEHLAAVRPPYVALENVAGFESSRARARLLSILERSGYTDVRERLLCPTELGVPNRRKRYYLVAARQQLAPHPPFGGDRRTLAELLDPSPPPGLDVEADLLARYRAALHIVSADDPTAVTRCFTSAYGRSPVRSGSYLAEAGAIRRFSPREILRFLGFPDSYRLPEDLRLTNGWRLAGNSLSIIATRWMLAAIPELAQPRDATSANSPDTVSTG